MTDKKALKAAFKLNPHGLRRMGVYQLKNQVNGKLYLEASSNVDGTMERDRSWLARGNHLNRELQADWDACGADAFAFEVLELLQPSDEPRNYREELAILKELWVESLQPFGERGYLRRR